MKIKVVGNRLWRMSRILARQMLLNVGTVVLVLLLLSTVDLVDAMPWRTTTQTSSSDRDFIMPYQGRLTDASGVPIDNIKPGLDMTFSLYVQETADTPVWIEQHSGVPISDGLFTVYLGSITSLDPALFDDDLWLGVKIGSDPEMTPRERVVPYVGTQSAGVPVGTVISWWRSDANTPLPSDEWAIADGSIVADPESPLNGQTLPDLTDRFVMGVAVDAVGQAGGSNTLDLSHRHQVEEHTHSIPSHKHSNGTLYAQVSVEDDRVYIKRYGNSFNASLANYTGSTHDNTHYTDGGADIEGHTAAWSGTSGSSQPNTNSQLSSTTDNRPAYVGLLFLVRIK